jgi:L-threonine-O-3-phosphate decarboxylase
LLRPKHGGNLDWAAAIAGCPVSSILDFSASINPLGPPASALAAIKSHLTSLTRYPDPQYRELRSALAQWHNIAPDWILPGNGAAELLTWAGRELAKLDSVYVLYPAFNDYERALNSFGAKICKHFLDLTTLTPVNPEKQGLLLNNPHNPTGKLWTVAAIRPYLSQFGLVVVDEAFMDFLLPEKQESLISLLPEFPNLVILRSLTKFYSLPGLRLGYVLAHPDRLLQWQAWRDPWSVNNLAVVAAIAGIQDKEFQQQTWDWLTGARQDLWQGLANFSQLQPQTSAANFLLVQCQSSCLPLQEALLKSHQIFIRDCLSFPELGSNYFRVAVRLPRENQRLLGALSEILPTK